MRIGIIYPGIDPIAPENWSGIPHGLAAGIFENGVEILPVGEVTSCGLGKAVVAASKGVAHKEDIAVRLRITRWARNQAMYEQLSRALPLDAVVAMGTEMYDLVRIVNGRTPCVTFDDATLVQQIRDPNSDISQANAPAKDLARSVFYQRAASRAAALCCVSTRWAAESFKEDYDIEKEKIIVTGMGHRPRMRPPDGFRDWSAPRFLFVGAEWQRKNGDSVLRSFEKVRQEVPSATLDLVGDHPPVSMPGVTGHGFLARDDAAAQLRLDRLYASATCFVLPSLFDAAGIAYLEAASSGLAVVATTQGGAPEMLGEGAILVNPYDQPALGDAMLALSDPGFAQSMGQKAFRGALSSSWREVARRLLEALGRPAASAGLPRQPSRHGRVGRHGRGGVRETAPRRRSMPRKSWPQVK